VSRLAIHLGAIVWLAGRMASQTIDPVHVGLGEESTTTERGLAVTRSPA